MVEQVGMLPPATRISVTMMDTVRKSYEGCFDTLAKVLHRQKKDSDCQMHQRLHCDYISPAWPM